MAIVQYDSKSNENAGSNKHKLVLKLDLDLPHIILSDIVSDITGPAYGGFIRWDSAKQEVEIARVPIGTVGNVNYAAQGKFPVSISLTDSKTASGEPATAFLDTLARKVEGIVGAIEAETARLLRPTHTARPVSGSTAPPPSSR